MKKFRIILAWSIAMLVMLTQPLSAMAESYRIAYDRGRIQRQYPPNAQLHVGLALSGGGARGLAHIGVIEVLTEQGIRIDNVAGTSMGSIIGGLYAAGYSPQTIRNIVSAIEWPDMFTSTPRREDIYIGEKETTQWPLFELRFEGFRAQLPSSFSSGQRISAMLSWLTLRSTYMCEGDFNRLPIPFRAIATDLKTGKKVTLASGNLGRAIQASSTIPLLFSPVPWDNYLLVDGGLRENLPVADAYEMGSDFVIGVAIEESMHEAGELSNPLNVADQATSIMMQGITRLSQQSADFVIHPNLEHFTSNDFSRIAETIQQGRDAANTVISALEDSLESRAPLGRSHVIERLDVYPTRFEHEMARLFKRDESNEMNQLTIIQNLESLWSSGRFCCIEADFSPNNGILSLKLTEVPSTVTITISGMDQSYNSDFYSLSTTVGGDHSINILVNTVDEYLHSIQAAGNSFAFISESTANNNSMDVKIEVPHLTGIFIEDDLNSRKSIILREFQINTGDVFDMDRLMRTMNNLYGTNFYETVYADVEKYQGGVAVNMRLDEKNWSVMRFGLRYDQTSGAEGRITLTRENILGFGNQLSFTGQSGDRRQIALIENKNERILQTLYTFSLKAYKRLLRRPVYAGDELQYEFQDKRWGSVVSLGQQMNKLGNAMIQLKSETVRTYFPIPAHEDNEKKELRSVIFRSLIDSYDRYPFPRDGLVNLIYIESTSHMLGGSEQFAKLFWKNSGVKTFMRRHTFSYGLIVGTSDPSTPGIEAFRLGGLRSRLNMYDPLTGGSQFYADFPGLNDAERIGTRLAVASLSYRLFVPRAFHLELLYGAGNVWNQGEIINIDSILQSYGIMGSFSTFMGPITFGWGITSEGDDRAYLAAGWEF